MANDNSILAVSDETVSTLSDQLLNTSGATPLHQRFRALFTLKSLCSSSPDSKQSAQIINAIALGFSSPRTSALLRHELAYVLGQIGSPLAVPSLQSVLSDVKGQEEMVRHEAAEALAALSSTESIELLRRFAKEEGRGGKDDGRVVRETCEIALAKLDWDESEEAKKTAEGDVKLDRQFTSIDPAPPLVAHSPLVRSVPSVKPSDQSNEVASLRASLLDTSIPLFTRYRAMFALRNIGTPEAIDALCDGFGDDSALFKHEIAFILGQLSHPHSIPALVQVLQKSHESAMVRHEAAEALGGIPSDGADGGKVLQLLREWAAKDEAPDVVRDSCVVAVDMWEYENSDQFQYANGLEGTQEHTVVAA